MSSPTENINRRSGSLDFTRTTEVYFCHECRKMHSVNLPPTFCCAVCSSPCVELIESDEQFKLLMPTHTRTLRDAAAGRSSSSANASPQSPTRLAPLLSSLSSPQRLRDMIMSSSLPSSPHPVTVPVAEQHQPRPYAFTGTRLQGNATEAIRTMPPMSTLPITSAVIPSVPLTTVIVRTRNSDGTETEMTAAASGTHGNALRQAVTGVLRAQVAAHAPIVVETSTRSAPESNTMVMPPAVPTPAPILRPAGFGLRRPRPPSYDEATYVSQARASSTQPPMSNEEPNPRRPALSRSSMPSDFPMSSMGSPDGYVVMSGSDLLNYIGLASAGASEDNTDTDNPQSAMPVQNLILAMLGSGLMRRSGGGGGSGDLQSFLNTLFSSQPSHQADPTPQSVIDALHTVPEVTPELREEHPHLNNACAVCQESLVQEERSSVSRPTSAAASPVAQSAPNFSSSEVIILPCNHCYHKGCLLPWLERSQQCPVCRQNVSGQPDEPQATESNSH